jgi:hypothetical protein
LSFDEKLKTMRHTIYEIDKGITDHLKFGAKSIEFVGFVSFSGDEKQLFSYNFVKNRACFIFFVYYCQII